MTEIKRDLNRVYSQDTHPDFKVDNEVHAMIEHFNGNLPSGGGEMGTLVRWFDSRPWVHQNDWKMIYDTALKTNKDAKKLSA